MITYEVSYKVNDQDRLVYYVHFSHTNLSKAEITESIERQIRKELNLRNSDEVQIISYFERQKE